MRELEGFFLENVAYCAAVKHRNPAESVYATISRANRERVLDEIRKVLKDKDGERLIYLFFVDKQTKQSLESIFGEFTLAEFIDYFESCRRCILNDNLSLNYMFQFINFFHLIGSFRILGDLASERTTINDMLLGIINSREFPLLIKYSASQIYVCKDINNSGLHENELLQAFYKQLINRVNEDGDFTRFIALYSMYYNSFHQTSAVITELREQIIDGASVDFNMLHTYLPQIHSILLRCHKIEFRDVINRDDRFVEMYLMEEHRSEEVVGVLNAVSCIA